MERDVRAESVRRGKAAHAATRDGRSAWREAARAARRNKAHAATQAELDATKGPSRAWRRAPARSGPRRVEDRTVTEPPTADGTGPELTTGRSRRQDAVLVP